MKLPAKACRRCEATVGLVKWHTVMLCPACLPKKPCLNCRKCAPEVEFATPRTRRCKACMAEHTKLLRGGDAAKKRKPKKSKVYKPDIGRKHLVWVRSQPCLVHGIGCAHRAIHAHHVRVAANSGTGMKPSDFECVPLCVTLHLEGHQTGWKTWEAKYGLNLRDEAMKVAARSPYRVDVVGADTYGGTVSGVGNVGFDPGASGQTGGNAPG